MIGHVLLAILTFLLTAITNSIFGSASFYIFAFLSGLLFIYLFLGYRLSLLSSMLFGFSLGLEVIGSSRPGFAFLLGGAILTLATYLPALLRFTTSIVQSIVGLLIVMLLYTTLLFNLTDTPTRMLFLIPVLLVLVLYVIGLHRLTTEGAYENA